ncbi:hypothetical protein MASR2M47_35810 [Draconibacterium sp.]|jgi:hypothetical protein
MPPRAAARLTIRTGIPCLQQAGYSRFIRWQLKIDTPLKGKNPTQIIAEKQTEAACKVSATAEWSTEVSGDVQQQLKVQTKSRARFQ